MRGGGVAGHLSGAQHRHRRPQLVPDRAWACGRRRPDRQGCLSADAAGRECGDDEHRSDCRYDGYAVYPERRGWRIGCRGKTDCGRLIYVTMSGTGHHVSRPFLDKDANARLLRRRLS